MTILAILLTSAALTRVGKVFAGIFWSVQFCLFVLITPFAPPQPRNQAAIAILNLITLTALVLRVLASSVNEWTETISNWFRRHPKIEGLSLSAFILLALLAGAEFLATQIQHFSLLRFDQPMITFYLGKAVEDWRQFHITADAARTPDPYLLWKPVALFPYNSRGYKGPEFDETKPKLTYRIVTLGDSNTDGPERGAWPEELGRLLNSSPDSPGGFEVINAGVAGYSSLQGVRRLEEVLTFHPDLVLVSFGANDAALVGIPDKDFQVGSTSLVRSLFKYKIVRLYRYLIAKQRAAADHTSDNMQRQSRVSLEDYEKNLSRMAELVRSRNGRIVFLTRPYDSTAMLRAPSFRWIHRAPGYRDLTLQLGKRLNVLVFDAYAAFEHGGSKVFADESHFTPLGHTQMAGLLLTFLSENHLLDTSQ